MKKSDLINLIISIILILSIGSLTGYTVGYFRATKNVFSEIKIVPETNPYITTIKLMEIRQNQLIGRVTGQKVRLAYSPENILELEKDTEFQIPLNEINLKDFYNSETIPEDIMFIASKNGKYYYSVFSKKALNISPKNRLYFSTSKEAEGNGYVKK